MHDGKTVLGKAMKGRLWTGKVLTTHGVD